MKTYTLLVVDDDPYVRSAISRRLQQVLGLDWHVYGCEDPELAIGWISSHGQVDVLLSDYNLEHLKLDGLDVIHAFRENSPMTVRLLMSANLGPAMNDKRYHGGPEQCYEKPFDAEEVRAYLVERGFFDGE